MKKLLALVLLFSIPFWGYPRTESEIKFNHFFKNSGLSGNSVLNIFQDRQGFLWVGTNGGLCRFDGYRFKVYNHDPDVSESISADAVFSICEDHEGYLWIGTRDKGLNRFDRKTETFFHFYHDPLDENSLIHNNIYSILEDSLGNLWLGTMGGLDRLDRENNRFVHYRFQPEDANSISNNYITWLYEAPSEPGILWITTAGGGLNRLDIRKMKFSHYRNHPQNEKSLSSDSTLAVCGGPGGFLWVSTNNGLNRFDRINHKFTRYFHDPLNPGSLSYNHTFYACPDMDGRLWVGTMGGGVNVLDHEKGKFTRLQNDPDNRQSISNDEINHIYVDNTGIVWIGTVWGLNQYDPREHFVNHLHHIPHYENSLSANRIYDISEDHSGHIWFATKHGINRLDPENRKFDHFFHVPDMSNSLSSNSTFCVYPDPDGSLWIGTLQGLDHLNQNLDEFTRYRHDPDRSASLSHNRVISVCRDRNGNLWVGTWIGLNRSGKRPGDFVRFFDKPSNPGEWYKYSFSTIVEDRSGVLWFGTRGGGLYRFYGEEFTHLVHKSNQSDSLASDFVHDIFMDSKGRVWIGTSEALCLVVSGENRFKHFTFNINGYNNPILGILEDEEGNLWLSSSELMIRFDPDIPNFKKFSSIKNLEIKEFMSGSCLKTQNGDMYFGGMEGLISFSPQNIKSNPRIPPIVITDVTVFGKDRERKTLPYGSGEVRVSYRDFPLHLEFAALNYTNSSKNQYAYRIDDINENWIFLGNTHELTLTQLPPGSHFFRVKGSNNDGIWNEKGTVLKIMVKPPFWKSWWFRLALLLLALGVVGLWHRTRMLRLTRKLKTEATMDRFLLKRGISDREKEIVLLMLKGKSNREIEDILFISLGTVKNHIYSIFNKLNVRSRVQFLTLFKNLKIDW